MIFKIIERGSCVLNAEELFVKEFKAYSKYKEHIISGADVSTNGQVAHVLQSLPPQMSSYWSNELQRQIPLLRGTIFNSDAADRLSFSSFIRSIIPPDLSIIDSGKGFQKYCVAKGITAPYFKDLNNTTVIVLSERSWNKRITGTDGKFILNTDGTPVTREVSIPANCKLVSSHKNIKLANYTVDEHGRKTRFSDDNFGYVDFVDSPKGRRYLYFMPKENLYNLNLNALVLSSSRLTVKYYWGRRYFFNWGLGSCYLYVAPFVPSIISPSYLAFCLKSSTNFTSEIERLEAYWQRAHCYENNGKRVQYPPVLYDLDMTSLEIAEGTHEGGDSNLAYYTLPQPEREPYNVVGDCLGGVDDESAVAPASF